MRQGEDFKFWGFTLEGQKWVELRQVTLVTLCPELYGDAEYRRVEFVVSRSMADRGAWVITELETGTKLPWAFCETRREAIETAQVYIRNRGTLAILMAIQRAKLLPGWFPLGESPKEVAAAQEGYQPLRLPEDLLPEECCEPTDLSSEECSPDTEKEYIPTYQELCTEIRIFNVRYPVGSLVIAEKADGKKVTTRVRHPAKIVADTPVVWLDGISGCYAMDRVEGASGHDRVDLFNDKYPVGSEVKATRDNGVVDDAKVMEPAIWFGGKAVVWIRRIGAMGAGYKNLDSINVLSAATQKKPVTELCTTSRGEGEMKEHPGVWCCERKHDCKWQGFALFRGLAWGKKEGPLDEWTKYHSEYCGGKLIQLLEPQDFPPSRPGLPFSSPRKNLMKFLEDNELNLSDEQENIVERLFSLPLGGGKSFLVAMLFRADPGARLHAKWMEEKEQEREEYNGS